MTAALLEAEPVLSTITNALARHRILGLVLREIEIPQATYDFVGHDHCLVDGMLKVVFHYFLPSTRRVRRQSAIIGGDLELTINLWAVSMTTQLSVVSNRSIIQGDTEKHVVNVIAPLREDLTGIVW